MATIKSFTSLEQSKVLAKILPIESADMYWLNRHIDLTETKYEVFVIEKSNKYIDFFKSYAIAIDNNEIIPCWSLAALLDIIPYGQVNKMAEDDNKYEAVSWNETDFDPILFVEGFDTPVDACYELILKLHEQKLL